MADELRADDGRFVSVVNRIRSAGCAVIVMGSPDGTSHMLVDAADCYLTAPHSGIVLPLDHALSRQRQ